METLQIGTPPEDENVVQLTDHDKAMIDKFEGKTPEKTPEKTESTVEGLPEGFTSVAELVAKYNELQAASAPVEQAPEGNTEDLTVNTTPTLEPFMDEFAEKGSLSDESYTKLQSMGLSKELVDGYIAGQQAQIELVQTKAFNAVGGKDAYTKLTEWARVNLSAEELTEYNSKVSRIGPDTLEAVTSLKARYDKTKGTKPNLLAGEAKGESIVGYESWKQVQADMSDPRYGKDPAFRAGVERKLAVSKF